MRGLYQISNLGNVKSLNYNHTGRPKLLSPKNHHTGYKFVMLCKDGRKTNKTVHVLVASAFLPNTAGKPCVNHIDGDKSNNTAGNLEWVTYKENTQHAIKTNLRRPAIMEGRTGTKNPLSVPVIQFSKDGRQIRKWGCISDAARSIKCTPAQIINCCAGRHKTCHGYIWKYEDA